MWCEVLIAWKSKEWRVECGEMCSVPGARETSTKPKRRQPSCLLPSCHSSRGSSLSSPSSFSKSSADFSLLATPSASPSPTLPSKVAFRTCSGWTPFAATMLEIAMSI